jgi:hypothetical protein
MREAVSRVTCSGASTSDESFYIFYGQRDDSFFLSPRSAPRAPNLTPHHGPSLFAAFSETEGAKHTAAINANTEEVVMRSHHPFPTPAQYPASRSVKPLLNPATAQALANVRKQKTRSP